MAERRVDLGIGLPASGAVLCVLGALVATLVACNERGSEPFIAAPVAVAAPAREPQALVAAGIQSLRARPWLEAAQLALEQPTPVDLPHAEWGGFRGHEPNARGVAFTAAAGQIIEIKLAQPDSDGAAPAASPPIDVELFLVDERGGQVRDVPLAQLPAGDPSLRFRLPREATYIVRLRPAPLVDAVYSLQLELGAVLPFPVRGYEVKSFFGAPRDHGKRHHEGVDIYAPRRTPVLAVADGQATYRENRLGGHTVWLATAAGVSYYYAHLERAAVGSNQRVRVGDVLGYVGDSGNAAEVGPHLHFGIYRWGDGAIDPEPLLETKRFGSVPRGIAPLDVDKPLQATCNVRPATTMTAFKRCSVGELLKQQPYSATGDACPEIAPPCLRMADAFEPAPLATTRLASELLGAAPLTASTASAAELARAALLVVAGDDEGARSLGACNESVDGLPGVCTARASQRVLF